MSGSTIAIVCIFAGFAVLELWRSNLFAKPEQTRDDAIVESVSMIVLLGYGPPGGELGCGQSTDGGQSVRPE